jgi:hypothetical protein
MIVCCVLRQTVHDLCVSPADVRLSEQYISQFLGQLTTLEESRFCELKYSLQNDHRGKVSDFE